MNEKNLIRHAQNGNKEALSELIEIYYPYVSRFTYKLCSSQTIYEDITQEVFLKLIKNIDHFDINGKASFSTYVMTIAKNCYIDYLRKQKKIVLEPIDYFEDQISYYSDIDFENYDIMKELDRLPIEQKEAIRLKYLEGLTLKEIASIHQTETKTIKSRIHSGIAKIRKSLIGGKKNG